MKKNLLSCVRYIRTASAILFLLLTLVPLFLVPTQNCCGSTQAVAASDDSAAKIAALVNDLRDPKFAVREAATQRLIEVGAPAIAALQLAGDSDSLEVRVRALTILASIQQSGDDSFDSTEQATIKQFKSAPALTRVAILRAETKTGATSLFLHLLDILVAEEKKSTSKDQAESPIETLITDETLAQFVSTLLDTSNWSGIEKVLTHPGIRKYSPVLRVVEAQQTGKLDVYIEDQFQKLSQAHAAQENVSTRELISLIGLFRVQRDFDRAKSVIQWLPDVELQRTLRNELLFQQGDWQEILRRTKLDPVDPDFVLANSLQQALLYHLIGDQTAVAEIKQQLRQQLATAVKEADSEEAPGQEPPAEGGANKGGIIDGAQDADSTDEEPASALLLRAQLRIVGALTLDWPLLVEFLEPDNLSSNVDLLIAHNRAAEALKLLKIGPDFKGRHEWMEAILKEVEEAQEKLNKRLSIRRDEESIRLQDLIEDKTHLASSVAEMMEQRGMDDEAQLYFQMIYAAGKSASDSNPMTILTQLMQLGRKDDYWQLVASILSDSNKLNLSNRAALGVQSDEAVRLLAGQWAGRIRGAIIDPFEQTKIIAAVMNSPWIDREEMDFNLDFEVARFRSQFDLNATGSVEFLLSQVLELNGQDEEAAQMLQQATTLGFPGAVKRTYQQAIATNDKRGILKYWFDAYGRPTETCLVAEQTALDLLETETDLDRIRDLKRQLKICRLAIATQWIGARSRVGTSQPFEMNEPHLTAFRLQCMVYGVSGDFIDKRYQHSDLANALNSEDANESHQGSIELATVMFDRLSYTTGSTSDIGWSFTSMRLSLALAQGMISRGKYDQAADLLIRQINFSPGDVSVGETTVKKLDEAGATEAADRVYRAVGKYFIESLQMYPESPLNRNNYAWLLATCNRDLEIARRHSLEAIRVRPDVEQYLDTLAEIEFLLGKPAAAFKLSKRCVQLGPTRNYYREQKERFRKAMSAAE